MERIDLYIDSTFIPQLEAFKRCFLEKVLPSFDGLKEEAEKMAEEEFERLSKSPGSSYTDPVDLAEKAYEKSIDYYIVMTNMRYGIIGLFIVGLYHLFEQHLFLFYKKVILKPHEEDKIKSNPGFPSLKKCFKEKDIDLESLGSYEQIDTLRLICNVIKHAEGGSVDKLRKRKPEYFNPPEVPKIFESLKGIKISPVMPLSGEDLKIPIKDFVEYCDAVVNFWQELKVVIS